MSHPANIIATLCTLCLFAVALPAQSGMVKKATTAATHQKTEKFQVLGNCDMCRRNIEGAAMAAGALQAHWDADTQLLTVTIDPSKTAVERVQKAVAMAGYDNARYRAPNAAYNSLRQCCQYDRDGWNKHKPASCPEDKHAKN